MKTLLPWQQANCAITQLYESILNPYLNAHMFIRKNVLLFYLVAMVTTAAFNVMETL